MNKYAEIYSKKGLETMIQENIVEIKRKEKEYKEVCEGEKYNSLCMKENKRIIQKEIIELKKHIEDFQKALKNKLGGIDNDKNEK